MTRSVHRKLWIFSRIRQTRPRARASAVVTRLAIVVLLVALPTGGTLLQAQGQAPSARRILHRAAPAYPALARSMALEGIVRMEVLVAADGSVKTVEVKGGHPVLTQAGINAVRQWKWEPAPRETREIVQVKFSPEQ